MERRLHRRRLVPACCRVGLRARHSHAVEIELVTQHPLVGKLIALLGADAVEDDPTSLRAYGADKSPFPNVEPGVVVRPATVPDVAQVLKLANETRTPVIARGGGFSLSGFPQLEPGEA